MNTPILIVIVKESFQEAWIEIVTYLSENKWQIFNLMVNIQNPDLLEETLHQKFTNFARKNGLIKPKDVAYTIFPHRLYATYKNATQLFDAYNRPTGLYARLRKRPRSGWGTYFRRMTYYKMI